MHSQHTWPLYGHKVFHPSMTLASPYMSAAADVCDLRDEHCMGSIPMCRSRFTACLFAMAGSLKDCCLHVLELASPLFTHMHSCLLSVYVWPFCPICFRFDQGAH